MLQALVQFEQHSCQRFHPFGHRINYANRKSCAPYISEVALLEYNLPSIQIFNRKFTRHKVYLKHSNTANFLSAV